MKSVDAHEDRGAKDPRRDSPSGFLVPGRDEGMRTEQYDRALNLSYVLSIAEHHHAIVTSARRVRHFEFRHPATVIRATKNGGRAVTYDISEEGIGLIVPFYCDLREQVMIGLKFRDGTSVELRARVARTVSLLDGLWEIGMLFL